MKLVSVGTFNLNNLFSRYNFKAEVSAAPAEEMDGESLLASIDDETFWLRSYQGRLVKQKKESDRLAVAERIIEMDVDVLGVQEVEDLATLRAFNRTDLGGMYDHVALVEGNDRRLIDVGFLSKLPLGRTFSHRFLAHEEDEGRPVFSRDLLAVEVLNEERSRVLFTAFNTHLKSPFIPRGQDRAVGEAANIARRRKQAEVIVDVLRSLGSRHYVLLGDMNDTPSSLALTALRESGLVVDAVGERPKEMGDGMKNDASGNPATTAWSHRFKEAGKAARYELYDHVWVSSNLADQLEGAFVHRRRKLTGDGSDHDLVGVTLRL